MNTDLRRFSAAAERNQGPLLAVLQQRLPPQGEALEVASGTGQHAAYLSAGLPGWRWQPTDGDADALLSIAAWCAGLPQVQAPRRLNLLDAPMDACESASLDLVFCANLLHISPWATCPALMQCARHWLRPGGWLITYGPYRVEGEPLAPGNLAFDADLRQRNPAWGLRSVQAVAAEALAAGLALAERVAMPANNLCLVFRPV